MDSTCWEDIQLQDVIHEKSPLRNANSNGFCSNGEVVSRLNGKCGEDDVFSEEEEDSEENYLTPPGTPVLTKTPTCVTRTTSSVSCGSAEHYSTSCSSLNEETVYRKRASRSRVGSMVEDLLNEIYLVLHQNNKDRRFSFSSDTSSLSTPEFSHGKNNPLRKCNLKAKGREELRELVHQLETDVIKMNAVLLQWLKRKDRLMTQRGQYFDLITASLQAISPKRSVDSNMRFTIEPFPGDSGFAQWHDAMRMVARLPGGIPNEFRNKLWLTLADRHIQARQITWSTSVKFCLNEKSNPEDDALGEQIVKDLHRTGCSLFSGEDSEKNQALLKQVLLAFARWNKDVGYCQGFNMLAAIILEVMEWDVEDSLKAMIFLIEGVLPKSYFANNLRGLSVDMAVFRELLKLRLPTLAKHLDRLQQEAQDYNTGAITEPPLINVFTMQWFLTLFSNCIPKKSVLRIWDLIFLEGNEILLRTALAIWDCLTDRILTVSSADEFYSIMGVLTREMMEFGVTDTDELIKTICTMASFPFPKLADLREKYTFNIRPLTSTFSLVKRGVQLFHSDDEEDPDIGEDDQMLVVNWCVSNGLLSNKGKDKRTGSRTPSPSSSNNAIGLHQLSSNSGNFLSVNNIDPQRTTLDISLLKKQYSKLKERQRQAQIILTEGFQQSQRNTFQRRASVTVNHLLYGKTALINKRPKRPSPVLQPLGKGNRWKPISERSKTVGDLSEKINQMKQTIGLSLRSSTGIALVMEEPKKFKGKREGINKEENVQPNGESISRDKAETLTWTQLRLERKREKLLRKYSEPSLSTCSESAHEEQEQHQQVVDGIPEELVLMKDLLSPPSPNKSDATNIMSSRSPATLSSRSLSTDSNPRSSSSSSTELCDEDEGLDEIDQDQDVVRPSSSSLEDTTSSLSSPEKPRKTQHDDNYVGQNFIVGSDRAASAKSNCLDMKPDNINSDDEDDEEKYSELKRELSNLSVEECIQRLNERMSTLIDKD